MRSVFLVADNIRSAHNVGSLLRTADGLGVKQVILCGYTPYPLSKTDDRLPHIAKKVNAAIHKSALGAEENVSWTRADSIGPVLEMLRNDGYELTALEQSPLAVPLNRYTAQPKVALIVGSEVGGIDKKTLLETDVIIEIPMYGRKESFNVAAAAAMALYHLCLLDKQDT